MSYTASTSVEAKTIRRVLNNGDADEVFDAFRMIQFGNFTTPLKRSFTGLTVAKSFDLTLIDATGETAGAGNAKRLPALMIMNLRVVSVTPGAAGTRVISDDGDTATSAIATISADGKTVTFEDGVTDFVIEYIPRSSKDPSGNFAVEL